MNCGKASTVFSATVSTKCRELNLCWRSTQPALLWSLALATTSPVVWSGQPTLRIDAKKVLRKTCDGASKVILIERMTAWFLYLVRTVTRSVIFRSGHCHTYNLDEDSVMILCQQSVPRIGVTWCLTFHCTHFRWTRFNRECITASTHQHLY